MQISSYWVFLLIIGLSVSCTPSKRLSKSALTPWQVSENDRFIDPESSPLTPEDRKTFKGLEFFPYDPSYKIIAHLERTPDAPLFEMATTTDRRPKYRQYGILRFELNNQKLQLNVYQSQDLSDNPAFRKLLFLPFYDASTGQSTYGGGRYISLTIPEGNEIIIDFNEAYNPYCAYRDGFSCPITPLENNLESVAIMAGTKDYKKGKY